MVHDPCACRRRARLPMRQLRLCKVRRRSYSRSAVFSAALSAPRRHRVRILAKRLRYALDLFAVVLPKTATERYIEALAELQDVLGHLNDAAVAKAVLPQLSKSNRLKRSAATWFDSVESDRVHDAERRLLKLSSSQKPWQ